MIVREAYRDVLVSVCRRHYSGELPLPPDAPALGPVQDASTTGCVFCERERCRYAAIGSDGTRLVVWGVGATERAATRDAARWLHIDRDTTPLCFAEIDAQTLARIKAGEVDCDSLGLETPELLADAQRAGVL